MSACVWCDAPTDATLCGPCAAVNYGPVYRCAIREHNATLGDHCAECADIAASAERRRARNAPHVTALHAIRAKLIAEWHVPWPGAEHGKALVGQMIDGALKDLR